MTVAINLSTVTASIAALSIAAVYPGATTNSSTNVTVLDIDALKDDLSHEVARGPVLAPMPNGFVKLDKVTLDAMGSGASAKKTIQYSLAYRLFYCTVGAGRGFFDVYSSAIATAVNVWNVLIANDTVAGCINLWPVGSLNITSVQDAAGNHYWGCDFTLQITDFINP
jgi:hypothetical protein